MRNFIESWHEVDAANAPKHHIDYLELAQNDQQFIQVRNQVMNVLRPVKGGKGIDIGCGLGMAVNELTEHGWHATGVDLSHTMVKEACRRFPHLEFQVSSALDLPFEDGALDFYRSERVYANIPEQQIESALAEAYRVLKPGGMIVLAEPDLETINFTCSNNNREIARAVIRAMVDTQHNGHAGNDARGQLIKMGFRHVQVTCCTHVFTELKRANPLALDMAFDAALTGEYVSQEQVKQLRQDLIQHENRDAFQFSCTSFIVSARRP